MTIEHIQDFLNEHNYDIRVLGNGRWIDQKCAMDNVCFIADCILDYLNKGGTQPFDSPTIWHTEYAKDNVSAIYGKPATDNYAAHDEFNKFFRQPMKLLSAAGILREYKKGLTIKFTVINQEILEFIALRERNAFTFLCLYIEKVLRDSGLWPSFERFFERQTENEYQTLKDRYAEFCIHYTPINTRVEADRIFIKVLNNLACKFQKRGTASGRLSKYIIHFDDIAYNKPNWRDELSGKDKNIARSEYVPSQAQNNYYSYRVNRVMKYLRQFNDRYNDGKSEVLDTLSIGAPATHVHHIFPRNQFRELAEYIENMIVLTSGQHLQKAHPDGNTSVINRDYQYLCLLKKTDSIRENIVENHGEPIIYNYEDFTYVLCVGLGTEYFSELPENDFDSIINKIEQYY